MREAKPSLDTPSNRELLSTLLTFEGSVGSTYSRLHRYSPRNIGFLALQGCPPEPVATFKKWNDLDRHVLKGSKAYSILRPINVKVEAGDDSEEEFKLIRRFKVVRALFAVSQTAGEELPPYEPPKWRTERALGSLAIKQVSFESYDGNTQGLSYDRNVAVSPVAKYPFKTLMHEASHVQHGHTTPENLASYYQHRGQFEFEAEASGYVVLNELGAMTDEMASVSRGYVQGWLQDEKPSEDSLRRVLNVSTKILDAGYEPADMPVTA